MSPDVADSLIKALVALLTVLTALLGAKVVQHDSALNGAMDQRIKDGAEAVITEHEAAAPPVPTVPLTPVQAARVAALQAQIESIRGGR